VLIDGGSYSAGSEVILAGGDSMKLAGAVLPTGITIRHTRLWRPLSWRTDGVNRVVKNLFELKTGVRVRVHDVLMEGNWQAGQTGNAIVITPRSGGAVYDVVFERIHVRNTSSGIQITGHDLPHLAPTPARTTGIVFRDSVFEVNRVAFGGRGILAEISMGPGTVDFENVVFVGDGAQVVYVGDRERIARVRFVNGYATAGVYGFMGGGYANARNWTAWTDSLEVTGNTFTGARSTLRINLPENNFVDRAKFGALVARRLQ
jgi:hypothetical protein